MTLKHLSLILFGSFIGGSLVAALMFSHINNRYKIGVNTGYIQGEYHIIEFIKTHLNNSKLTASTPIILNQYLDHKASRVTVIMINGVKTLRVE